MSILKVARMGHPVLRAQTRPLERSDLRKAATQKLIDDMIDTMIEYHGVGLAAPQVHEELRLFVALLDANEAGESESEPAVIVNPEISVGGEIVEGWEGCLSIPDIRGRVPRARDITLRALNRRGEPIELDPLPSFERRIVHEYLRDRGDVETHSEGDEPDRYIVVTPAE